MITTAARGTQREEPTPSEIAARCAEIQSRWSAAEWRSRCSLPTDAWLPPVVTIEGDGRASE